MRCLFPLLLLLHLLPSPHTALPSENTASAAALSLLSLDNALPSSTRTSSSAEIAASSLVELQKLDARVTRRIASRRRRRRAPVKLQHRPQFSPVKGEEGGAADEGGDGGGTRPSADLGNTDAEGLVANPTPTKRQANRTMLANSTAPPREIDVGYVFSLLWGARRPPCSARPDTRTPPSPCAPRPLPRLHLEAATMLLHTLQCASFLDTSVPPTPPS